MRTDSGTLDGTPEKRIFWSIISDYDFKTALTELVDNCIDLWVAGDKKSHLKVVITVDAERQLLSVADNGGGIPREDLRLLVTPGGSNNDGDSKTIGVFGVGSKRAVVALGEHIVIKTRHQDKQTYELEITKDWIDSPGWLMPAYEVSDIPKGSTLIQVSQLRRAVSEDEVEDLRLHFGATYQRFLKSGKCEIEINKVQVVPIAFDRWAYPPDFPPKITMFPVKPDGETEIAVTIEAGLITDRNPIAENYGVYVYCNDRLVVKELRAKDVGYFVTAEAGTPHPDASLCRVIVHFEGAAKWMPWNSNKTNINPKHATFQMALPPVVTLCAHFSKLSRSLKGTWEETVFPHKEGKHEEITEEQALNVKRMVLPKVPRTNKAKVEHLREKNKSVLAFRPYVVGLIEAVAAVDLVTNHRFETGNRMALILLDSTYEIAVKEYIVHNKDVFGNQDLSTLFKDRTAVMHKIRTKVHIDQGIVDLAEHYYDFRNKLIHEKATFGITDQDVVRYRDAIQKLLTQLYNVIW